MPLMISYECSFIWISFCILFFLIFSVVWLLAWSRIVLAAAMWQHPHILILDELADYMDFEDLEALKFALQRFAGGVIMVTQNEPWECVMVRCYWHFLCGMSLFWGVVGLSSFGGFFFRHLAVLRKSFVEWPQRSGSWTWGCYMWSIWWRSPLFRWNETFPLWIACFCRR